jgi:hypothetical protein
MGNIAKDDEVLLELGITTTATQDERLIVQTAITFAEGAVRRHLRYDPVSRSRTEYYPTIDLRRLHRGAVWESEGDEAVLRRVAEAATDELQLRHIPIRSITGLRVDYDGRSGTRSGSFGADTAWTEGTDFWANYDILDSSSNSVCLDGILRSHGRWPTTPGTVRVVYTAGYTDEEFHGADTSIDAVPIWEAVINEATRKAKKAFVNQKQNFGWAAGPLTSEKLGDYGYTVDSSTAKKLFGSSLDLMPETKEKLSEFVNLGYMLGG